MKKTIVIQIGNSDNKLSQELWSKYISAVQCVLFEFKAEMHFEGFSLANAPWQNACFVCCVNIDLIDSLKYRVSGLKKRFFQDSIAWQEGDTEFI